MIRKSFTFVSNRFVSVLLVGSLVLLGVSEYHQWQTKQKITKQINSLKAEAATVEEKNSQLEDSLKYLSSTSATERLARQQNLKKEGEIAIVFMSEKQVEGVVAGASTKSNVAAWISYFFGKK